jgi:RNA polymerase sigma-70 factor (ECF subfamily)
MVGVDEQTAPAPSRATSDTQPSGSDPASSLAAVYRDYPGLRALILRRVRDPEVAADILQDAAVTTLEKLRSGEIAHPENLGGYLYRVAINHLRNHRRKDRSALSSPEQLDELRDSVDDPEWEGIGRPQWAAAARRVLQELPAARDRDLLVRFYLNDEDKDAICRVLNLSQEHFNRVIFRARNRFRELLEQRGFGRGDLLTILAIGLYALSGGQGNLRATGGVAVAQNAAAAAVSASLQGGGA